MRHHHATPPPTRHQHGFTLIELLLYVTIVGSLLISLSYYFATVADARVKNQSISEVDDQGAAAMDYITRSIRGASTISVPVAGASGSSATMTVAGVTTIFSVSGTTLQVKEGATTYNLTNSKVQVQAGSLSFKNLTRSGTAGVMQVSFILSRVNNTGHTEYTFQRTFTGSAEIAW